MMPGPIRGEPLGTVIEQIRMAGLAFSDRMEFRIFGSPA